MKILNALPMSIVPDGAFRLETITTEAARALLIETGVDSAVGHESTAAIISGLLGLEVPFNRVSLEVLQAPQTVMIAAYMGPRLPEGATTLPEGAKIEFRVLTLE